jgi:hypothetical protein
VHCADEHRFFGALANDLPSVADFDPRQKGGFLVQVFRHCCEARRDNASGVVAGSVHYVKRHRCSKIHHHHRSSKTVPRSYRVGKPIRPDASGFGIIDTEPG